MSVVVPAVRNDFLAELAALRPGPHGVHLTQVCRRLRSILGVARVRLVLADGLEFAWPDGIEQRRPRSCRQAQLIVGDQYMGVLILEGHTRWGLALQLSCGGQRLLDEVADLLGAVLPSVRMQIELDQSLESARGHAERIAALRRRTFGERDAERRELERDLHDGAQHHLVALGMTLGLLELQVRANDQGGVSKELQRLREGLDRAERALRLTTAGGSPVLLEAGVLAALEAEFRDAGAQVRLEATEWDTARRYDPMAEMAVYFICLEAVNNARKHAPGADVLVRLSDDLPGLAFSVSDNGPGLPHARLEAASGVANMRRRIVAVGGRLQVRTAPGAGTTIQGFIPF